MAGMTEDEDVQPGKFEKCMQVRLFVCLSFYASLIQPIMNQWISYVYGQFAKSQRHHG